MFRWISFQTEPFLSTSSVNRISSFSLFFFFLFSLIVGLLTKKEREGDTSSSVIYDFIVSKRATSHTRETIVEMKKALLMLPRHHWIASLSVWHDCAHWRQSQQQPLIIRLSSFLQPFFSARQRNHLSFHNGATNFLRRESIGTKKRLRHFFSNGEHTRYFETDTQKIFCSHAVQICPFLRKLINLFRGRRHNFFLTSREHEESTRES